MYYDQNFNHYIEQLHQTIQAQQERMQQLEKNIESLQQDFSGLKKEPRLAVDRIEYKFDQLKIERLEGTLNIGLTPKAGQQLLDDLSVDGASSDPNGHQVHNDNDTEIPDHPNVARHIIKDLNDYIDSQLLSDMKMIEGHLQMPLNDSYRQFIIQDVRKQVDDRVGEYLQEYNNKEILEKPDQIEQIIFNKVKRDMLKGIEAFIMKIKQGEGGGGQ